MVERVKPGGLVAIGTKLEGFTAPRSIAFDPVHDRMYVPNGGINTVSVIDTTTNTVVGSPIVVGNTPLGIAFDPVHDRMYVTNLNSNTVSVIDTNTNTVVGSPILVGNGPYAIAFASSLS